MKRTWVFHPFLFALFPILFVYSQNLEHLTFSKAWPSIVILLGFVLVAFPIFALLLRSTERAGIIIALFLLLFFSYGPVYSLIWRGERGSAIIDGASMLLIVWMVVFVGAMAFVVKAERGLEEITNILNVMALVLIVLPSFDIALHEFSSGAGRQVDGAFDPVDIPQATSTAPGTLPDIYYIILDGYARADILKEIYDYDNTEFLDFLEQRGFFVANKSQANYAHTVLSLASSLNLDYLDDQAARVGLDSNNRQPFGQLIENSVVLHFLKQQGYTTVAFPTGYSLTELDNADVYFGSGQSLNELEIGLLISTPIPWLLVKQRQVDPYAPRAHSIRYILDHLAEAAQLPSPHFVFAHVLCPHPPFVIDEHGNEIAPEGEFNMGEGSDFLKTNTREQYLEGYRGQVTFVNHRVEAVLDDLLTQSSRPAIIILQADHGPGSLLDWDDPDNTYFKERLTILNAYLLPGPATVKPYDEITPVNTFRLIFDNYFGTELELLEDESYFSTWEHPYRFINVTDDVLTGHWTRPSE
jgi:hypothetical protein